MKQDIQKYIKHIIQEYKTRFDLVEVHVRLRVKSTKKTDPQIPDIMTNIRVLKGVNTARQIVPIRKIKGGRDVLDLSIKYMPEVSNPHLYIQKLAKMLRAIPGIEIVKVLSVGGQVLTKDDGSSYVF
jgi:hypothetical protein